MHDIIRLFLAMCASQGILVLSIISVAVFFYFQDQPKSSQNTSSSLSEDELRKIRRKRMATIAQARVVYEDKKKTSTQTNTSQPTTPKTVDTSRGNKENWSVGTSSLDDIVSNTKSQQKEDMEVNSSGRISSSISSNKNVSTYVDDTKGWGSGQEASEEDGSNSTSECFEKSGEEGGALLGIVPNDSRERTQQAIAKYLAGSARVMSTFSPNNNTQRIHIEGMFLSQHDVGSSACDDDSSEDDSSDSSTISSLSACSDLDIYAQDVQTNAIEDIIIRHMKERKTILQHQLVSYIQSWYCYTLKSEEINNGIEALIHKGYLERRVGDSERLRYLPLM